MPVFSPAQKGAWEKHSTRRSLARKKALCYNLEKILRQEKYSRKGTIAMAGRMENMSTLCYLERDGEYLMLHRTVKKQDVNRDKWIGVGGHFEEGESPEECVLREVKEETGYTLTSFRYRGLLTFLSGDGVTEYISLFTADGFMGEPIACDEGELVWVSREKLFDLNLWEGDKIFFKLLEEERPFFSLKLVYDGHSRLTEAVLDGWPLDLSRLPALLPPQWEIRHGTIEDLEAVAALEAACFPEAEAAGKEALRQRLLTYPEHFWLLFWDGELAGLIDGMVTNEAKLRDEMFENASLHKEDGDWQMLFGVAVLPKYQRQGVCAAVMRQVITDAKAQGRKGIFLTCKEELIPYYERFGFVKEGVSQSVHGGAVWYDMRLTLQPMRSV